MITLFKNFITILNNPTEQNFNLKISNKTLNKDYFFNIINSKKLIEYINNKAQDKFI